MAPKPAFHGVSKLVVIASAGTLLVSACTLTIGFKPPKHTSSPLPSPTPTAVLQASSTTFHAGEVGAAYTTVALAATGGLEPYTWTLVSGALPDGLMLSASGAVSGTPVKPGSFWFNVGVADSKGGTASVPGAIAVAAAPTASLVPACAKYCSVEVGCGDVCGAFGSLSGGTAPITYSVHPGGLIPGGTHVNGFALAGTFSQKAQFWQFTVVATDAFGLTASLTPTFYVYPHISLAGGACSGNFGTGCAVKLAISGGTPAANPSVKLVSEAVNPGSPTGGSCWQANATSPPAGYGLSVSGGFVTLSIPAGLINGYGAIWTITVTDSSVCSAGVYCVSPPAIVPIGVQCG